MSANQRNPDWNSPEDFFTVVCRPALPKDTQPVMDLTRFIWDGDDYIPYVWEEWLNDYEGMLGVAEYGGRVVGFGKLSLLAPGQWWMEGLRVHPHFQGQGIGSHIHSYLLKFWLKNGDGVLRLTTSSTREPVHLMCEKTGFHRVGEFTRFKASALDEPNFEFTSLRLEEISEAVKFLENSETMQFSSYLMDLGWQWVKLNTHNLYEAVDKGHAWWWQGGKGLLAIWEEDWEEETSAFLMFAACEMKRLAEMLLDFRKLVASSGHQFAAWFVPLKEELVDLLEVAGYQRDSDHALYLFEREHP